MKGKQLLIWLVSWKVLVTVCTLLGVILLPFSFHFTARSAGYGLQLPYILAVWGNFDGVHYMVIAEKGYELLTQPFFPLYPLTIRLVHIVTSFRTLRSALIASHLEFLAAIPIVNRLLKRDEIPEKLQLWFWMVLLLFPTSAFYGAAYNDSLFFLFATLTILMARTGRWWWAGVVAAVATMTRLNGLALAIYLVVEYCLQDETIITTWQPAQWWAKLKERCHVPTLFRSGIASVVLVPLSFLGYLLYIQWDTGNWRYLFTTMQNWNQHNLTFPGLILWRYLKILMINSPNQLNYWVAVVELIFVLWYGYLAYWSFKRIRFSYWLFMVISFTIPALTGTFSGMPRYALHLYPFFLATSLWVSTQSKAVKTTYLVISLALMLFIITLFTRGYFVT